MNKTPYNLGETLELARQRFSAGCAQSMAVNSACLFMPEDSQFVVPLFTQNYFVSYPDGLVTRQDTNEEASMTTAILLMHYLTRATGVSLTGGWISYKELPGGAIYIDPFNKRAVLPFIKYFGDCPQDFARAAELLGGERAGYGHLAYRLPVLPRVPLLYILWEGDEEFSPSATILFDSRADEYLHPEDYAILAGMTSGALVKTLR